MKRKGFNNFATRFPGTSPTFICDVCGKRTRDTGDNGGTGLCPQCYSDFEEENRLSDYDVKCKVCGTQLYDPSEASRSNLCDACYEKGAR